MREVIITSILGEFDQKKTIFWGVFLVQVQWFKTGTWYGLVIIILKFNTKLAETLKLKVRKFWKLIPIYLGVIRELGVTYF